MSANVKPARNFGTTDRLAALKLQIMASEVATRVGARIRQRREEMGLKQRQLADLIESDAVDNQRISDWERGVNQPSERYMQRLIEVLERPHAWFYAEDNSTETPDLLGELAPDQLSRIEAKLDEILARLDAANIKPLSPGQIAKRAADRADARTAQAQSSRGDTRRKAKAA